MTKNTDKVTKMSRWEAINKFDMRYLSYRDKSTGQIYTLESLGSSKSDAVTNPYRDSEEAALRFLFTQIAEPPVFAKAEIVRIPDTVYLPLEIDPTGQNNKVYVLRIARDEDGFPLKHEDGHVKWEYFEDIVTEFSSIDPVHAHDRNKNQYPYSHTIQWKTQMGVGFQTPLNDTPSSYNNQFVFSSLDALKAFAEKLPKTHIDALKKLQGVFDAAIKDFGAANDDKPAVAAEAPSVMTQG